MIELYYEAEQRGYAVVGTTNRTEYLTGFYIKWGDDSSDIEPIMHFIKTQVFETGKRAWNPSKDNRQKTEPGHSSRITDEFAMGITYGDLDRILQKIELDQPLSDEKQGCREKGP